MDNLCQYPLGSAIATKGILESSPFNAANEVYLENEPTFLLKPFHLHTENRHIGIPKLLYT